MIKSLLLSFLKTYNQDREKTDMKLLKAILEKFKSVYNGAADLFIKGCEPDSLDSVLEYFNKPSTPTRGINPVVPFGGF